MKTIKNNSLELLKTNKIEALLDEDYDKKQCFNSFLDIMQEILSSADIEELYKAS